MSKVQTTKTITSSKRLTCCSSLRSSRCLTRRTLNNCLRSCAISSRSFCASSSSLFSICCRCLCYKTNTPSTLPTDSQATHLCCRCLSLCFKFVQGSHQLAEHATVSIDKWHLQYTVAEVLQLNRLTGLCLQVVH